MNKENNNEPIVDEGAGEEMKMPEETFGEPNADGSKSKILGPVLGVLIIVLMLLLGGLYLWNETLKSEVSETVNVVERPTAEMNNEPESNNAEADTQTLQTVSTSDELSAIEADLESTNLDSLNEELNAIESELDSSTQ